MAEPTPPADKRTRLVETAATLSHAKGFNQTTLADVAFESGVPLGNVYYYFKTKDALGAAVISRLARGGEALRARWDTNADPRSRLHAFIQMSVDNRDSLARSGCPVGTLCAELHKQGGQLAQDAGKLFADLLSWIQAQFRAMGKGDEADALAVQLLSAIEGASLLTHTFHDPRYVQQEAGRLQQWIRSL